ncbi:DUF2953 domain-containing protein [Anaerocolumna sp.]|uniref:DUF2953 domain-containing protein n=1 Tax=Anaerocolumna sp. TaxID=2041569 RepID=UPI0028B1C689|nr:DUF2953 domain-containing protein [Anaerocolumna sp.]
MVNLILLILKILVIILASILGILLLLVLIVLLVPIRYQLYGEKRDEIKLEGKASWLLRLIYLRFTYESNKFIIRVRIFGKLFYDSQNYNSKKKVKKEKKKKVKNKKRKEGNGKEQSRKENKEIEDRVGTSKDTEENGLAEEAADNIIGKVNPEYIQETIDKAKDAIIEKAKEEFIEEPIDNAEAKTYKKEKAESIDETKETEEDSSDYHKDNGNNKGLFSKIKAFLRKLLKIPKKIIKLFTKIKNSLKKVYYIIVEILGKLHKIRAFLKNEVNKKGIKYIFLSLKKIFKHIRPQKLKIDGEFGTGDPCSTGQLLGGLAVFYGYYGENAHIVPNFETAILEGSIFCKGRIRLFTLLIICIKLIFNKEFRKMIENFKAFKEEL